MLKLRKGAEGRFFFTEKMKEKNEEEMSVVRNEGAWAYLGGKEKAVKKDPDTDYFCGACVEFQELDKMLYSFVSKKAKEGYVFVYRKLICISVVTRKTYFKLEGFKIAEKEAYLLLAKEETFILYQYEQSN